MYFVKQPMVTSFVEAFIGSICLKKMKNYCVHENALFACRQKNEIYYLFRNPCVFSDLSKRLHDINKMNVILFLMMSITNIRQISIS